LYYYLDSTPTHTYMKYLYKYPLEAFPYDDLVEENGKRNRKELEYELLDTGLFDDGKYVDVEVEYAKAGPEDVLIRIRLHNRSKEAATIHLLPTLWFRNLWRIGQVQQRPVIHHLEVFRNFQRVRAVHEDLDHDYYFYFENPTRTLFTENDTNRARVYGEKKKENPFVKDAFHRAVIEGEYDFLAEKNSGTKFSPHFEVEIEAEGSQEIRLRLCTELLAQSPLGKNFEKVFDQRIQEADEFYATLLPEGADEDTANIQRQAFAGMMWTKQFYHIDMPLWLDGDPGHPSPPESRKHGRNSHWRTLNNEDIISMPDKWEYPWYAVWDLAFHCIPLARLDVNFAKKQLILFLREWYMAPNGQIPAYEWNFSDVNPPVHAFAALKVYQMEKEQTGKGDIKFLKRVFQKLMLNFTWWVNRKDVNGNNIFEGGFLGLDNIGIFDRSHELPGGGHLEQADGTSWMAMYSLNLLQMALEISIHDDSFEDVATKFFEHFVYIADTLNKLGEEWMSLWDPEDGFYYDVLMLPDDSYLPIKVRSLVGLTPLFATLVINEEMQDHVPEFMRRLEWFWNYYLAENPYCVMDRHRLSEQQGDILLAMVSGQRLQKLLTAMLDEAEFLAPGGIRSLSKYHAEHPYHTTIAGEEYGITYTPGESDTAMFGGNSNWRGPVWFPMSYMLIESLRSFHRYLGEEFQVEYPSGSGNWMNLSQIADQIADRMIGIFRKDETNHRPVNGTDFIYRDDPHFRDLVLFYEYFEGDTSRGLGASHQTGWTGLVAELIYEQGKK
ncbi:MAG: glucosidase, partial [Bacteroidota bacterium]